MEAASTFVLVDQPAEAIEEAYENQRRYPIKGWSDSVLLLTDRKKWSTKDGVHERKLELITPPAGYEWESFWQVETKEGETDADGWMYAFDFPLKYGPKQNFTTWVRRRKWTRKAIPTGGVPHPRPVQVPLPVAQPVPSSGGAPQPTAAKQELEHALAQQALAPPAPETPKVNPIIQKWNKHRGSRCGAVTINVDSFAHPRSSSILVEVSQSSRTFKSNAMSYDSVAHQCMMNFETYLLISDDSDPIHFDFYEPVPLAKDVFRGRAVLVLRTAECTPMVSGKDTYVECGSAHLPLLPRPLDNNTLLTAPESLGFATVSWTFELREMISTAANSANVLDFCDVCGHAMGACQCLKPTSSIVSEPSMDVHVVPPPKRKGALLIVRLRTAKGLNNKAKVDPYVTLNAYNYEGKLVHVQSKCGGNDTQWNETLVVEIGDCAAVHLTPEGTAPFSSTGSQYIEVWNHNAMDGIFSVPKFLGCADISPLEHEGQQVELRLRKRFHESDPQVASSPDLGSVTASISWIRYCCWD